MQYEPIEPGLFRLHTPAGALSIPTTEEDLVAAGHTPLTAPGSGALAYNSAGAPPAQRLDAGGSLGAMSDADMADAIRGQVANEQRAELVDHLKLGAGNNAHAAPTAAPTARTFDSLSSIRATPKEGEKGELRGGARRVEIPDRPDAADAAPARPAGHFVKGGDVRAAYKVEKTATNPEDIEAAENAEADASIDRKLSAQNIAERKASASEAQSAAMGRDIRREEQAIEAQRARNEAIRADFAERQGAIDNERKAVETLQVNPREYIDNQPAWARIVSAISVLGGGLQSAFNGGRNPALEAINQEVERNIDAQKQNIQLRRQGLAARETELERLTRLYGSPDAAEAELRDRQRSLIQAYAIKQATDAGALDAADNLRTQFADWDKERAQDRLKRQAALAGSVEESWVNVPDHYVGSAPKVNEADVQKLAKAREEAGLGASEGDKGELADLMAELPEGELPTAESRNVVSRATRAALDFVGGQGTGSEALDTASERAATSKFERVINAYKSKYLGAARSPAELEDFARGFANVRTKEGLRQYVQGLDRQIARRDAGVKGGFRPEVVETYEERKRSREPRARPSSMRSE